LYTPFFSIPKSLVRITLSSTDADEEEDAEDCSGGMKHPLEIFPHRFFTSFINAPSLRAVMTFHSATIFFAASLGWYRIGCFEQTIFSKGTTTSPLRWAFHSFLSQHGSSREKRKGRTTRGLDGMPGDDGGRADSKTLGVEDAWGWGGRCTAAEEEEDANLLLSGEVVLVAAEEAATVMALLERPAGGKGEEVEILFMPPLPESLKKDKKLDRAGAGGGWRAGRECALELEVDEDGEEEGRARMRGGETHEKGCAQGSEQRGKGGGGEGGRERLDAVCGARTVASGSPLEYAGAQ